MENVLSLQLLGTDLSLDASCSNSSVSCPSKASCQSHNSSSKASSVDTW